MTDFRRFDIKTVRELKAALAALGVSLPLSEDTAVLGEPLTIGRKTIPNRMVIQPMEGCDGTRDGRPGELTYRRFRRFASGGAGLLWFEATAVIQEGRANPRQLLLTRDTLKDFTHLRKASVSEAIMKFGVDRIPYTVLQLTHSGRYSRPDDIPRPLIAANNPFLDSSLPDDYRLITDGELEELEDRYADAAELAHEAGFDAVDIKSCHRYLVSELLSAFTRKGTYGGSFENRTRFLVNILDKIRARTSGECGVTVRLNAYDAIPYPYGWGVNREDHRKYDLTEPLKLIRLLSDRGVRLIDITAGNPYYNPHVNRPYDTGPYIPPEHPLAGVARLLRISRELKAAASEIAVVASGFSWLREFGAHCASGGIRDGWFALAGFGRQAFAYPQFAEDILTKGGMDRKKCCIACGKCSEIMRFGGKAGCVIRDSEVYLPLYREARKGKPSAVGKHTAEHV